MVQGKCYFKNSKIIWDDSFDKLISRLSTGKQWISELKNKSVKLLKWKYEEKRGKKVNKRQIMPVHLRDAAYHVKRLSQKTWILGVLELCKLEQAESNTHLNISEPNYWKSNRRKDLRQEKKFTHREAQIQFIWIRDDLYSEPHIVHSQIMIILWEQSLLFKCCVFKDKSVPEQVSASEESQFVSVAPKDEPIPFI